MGLSHICDLAIGVIGPEADVEPTVGGEDHRLGLAARRVAAALDRRCGGEAMGGDPVEGRGGRWPLHAELLELPDIMLLCLGVARRPAGNDQIVDFERDLVAAIGARELDLHSKTPFVLTDRFGGHFGAASRARDVVAPLIGT